MRKVDQSVFEGNVKALVDLQGIYPVKWADWRLHPSCAPIRKKTKIFVINACDINHMEHSPMDRVKASIHTKHSYIDTYNTSIHVKK